MKQILDNYANALICHDCGEIFSQGDVASTRRDEECCPHCGHTNCIHDADSDDVAQYAIEELRVALSMQDAAAKLVASLQQANGALMTELLLEQRRSADLDAELVSTRHHLDVLRSTHNMRAAS